MSFITFSLYSQKIDTVINSKILTSYVSYYYHLPVIVTYKLYQGGGESSRKGLRFKSQKHPKLYSKEYSHSGYEIGHLANAEDFAYNDSLIKMTFFFYNAIPQRCNLNRGIWKHDETIVRNLSKEDSLLILTGPIFIDRSYSDNGLMRVPDMCYKVVQSLTSRKILLSRIYTNKDAGNVSTDVSIYTINDYFSKGGISIRLEHLLK